MCYLHALKLGGFIPESWGSRHLFTLRRPAKSRRKTPCTGYQTKIAPLQFKQRYGYNARPEHS
jgi:hypothetical protein